MNRPKSYFPKLVHINELIFFANLQTGACNFAKNDFFADSFKESLFQSFKLLIKLKWGSLFLSAVSVCWLRRQIQKLYHMWLFTLIVHDCKILTWMLVAEFLNWPLIIWIKHFVLIQFLIAKLFNIFQNNN